MTTAPDRALIACNCLECQGRTATIPTRRLQLIEHLSPDAYDRITHQLVATAAATPKEENSR